MQAWAVFPGARAADGLYESFYLRAVSPKAPVGVWIRYTVHKRPGRPATGSVWCTVFDAARGAPFMHKVTVPEPGVPPDAWIEIAHGSKIGSDGAQGSCGPASWSLRFSEAEQELRHLRPELLYRTRLPRTKLTSLAPLLRIDGVLELPDRPPLVLDGWPGMVGHNWGKEHAARWIWLHGCAFEDRPGDWIDIAAGRLAIGGRMTPWVVNGTVSAGGRRRRLGGLLGRPSVQASAEGCELSVGVAGGGTVVVRANVPAGAAAGWRYADPGGEEHEVVNCSVSALRVELSDSNNRTVMLDSPYGGAFELGMRAGEADHAVALAPFPDG